MSSDSMKKMRKYFVFFLAFVLFSGTALHSHAVSASSYSSGSENVEELLNESDLESLEDVFHAIETMPDKIIEAEDTEAAAEWLENNTDHDIHINADGDIVVSGVVGCVTAVGAAILNNAFPITKLAKIKDAIKAAGGATKFVRSLLTHYDLYRSAGYSKTASIKNGIKKAAKDAGPDVRSALLDFFLLGAIYSECFE